MKHTSDKGVTSLGIMSAEVASFVAFAQTLAIIIGGITLIVIARLLGQADYGIYFLAFGTASFFGSFTAIGLNMYLNKQIPYFLARRDKMKMQELIGDSFIVLVTIGVLATLLGVAFSGTISKYVFHSVDYAGVIDLALLSVIFSTLFGIEYSVLIAFRDGKGSAVTQISYSLLQSFTSIALVALGYGVLGAVTGTVVGPLAGMLVGIALIVGHSRISFNLGGIRERLRKMFFFSLPVAGSGIINSLTNNFAILLLGIFTLPVVGSFGIAYKMSTLISSVIGFVGVVLVQMFASALADYRGVRRLGRLYNYSVYFGVLITAPIAVYLIDFAHAFVSSVFPGYQTAQFYIPLLSIGLLLGVIGGYASSLLISAGRVNRYLRYTIIISFAQFLLLLLLVPFAGAYGVIIGFFFFGSLASDYLYIRYVRTSMHISTRLKEVVRILFASVLLAVLLLPITLINIRATLQLIVGVVGVLLLYPPLLVKTKALGKEEFDLLDRISRDVHVFGKLLKLVLVYTAIFF